MRLSEMSLESKNSNISIVLNILSGNETTTSLVRNIRHLRWPRRKNTTPFGKATSWLDCYWGERTRLHLWWGTALVKNDTHNNSEMWERDELKELSAGNCMHFANSLLPWHLYMHWSKEELIPKIGNAKDTLLPANEIHRVFSQGPFCLRYH